MEYHRRRKIRWAKHSRFQPYLQKYFCVVLAITALYLVQLKRDAYIHRKTFMVPLKTVKMQKFCPANLSMFTVVS